MLRRRLRFAGDVAVSLVAVGAGWPAAGTPVEAALAVASGTALLARHARPLAVAVLVLLLTTSSLAAGTQVPGLAGPLVAAYSVAARCRVRTSLIVAALTALVAAVPTAASSDGLTTGLAAVATAAALPAAAWALGALVRSRRETLEALRARADLVEQDRDLTVALEVERERARIMREMHDVMGHSLSVIAVQADAAAAVLTREPAAAAAAVNRVGTVAREALAEIRTVIRATRAEGAPDLPRGPDLTRLAALITTAQEAGTPTRLRVTGDVRGIGTAQSTATYRIVQESLTNARRHAGPRSSVDVRIDITDLAVDVLVSSVGRARGHEAGPTRDGTGIAVMRERATQLGGTLRAGWVSDVAFEVSAHLPHSVPTGRP
jgi:signal transduction histidine kinase